MKEPTLLQARCEHHPDVVAWMAVDYIPDAIWAICPRCDLQPDPDQDGWGIPSIPKVEA